MTCCPRCELERECERVGTSPLFETGGLRIYDGLIDAVTREVLLDEAISRPARFDCQPAGVDREQVRGGEPARSVFCVEGGLVQDALFLAPSLWRFIAEQVQAEVRACGVRGTYSMYLGAGAHLGLHRDVRGCDLALITCLHDTHPDGDAGAMEIWPDDLTTPLGELRLAHGGSRQRVKLFPGQTLLFHGGVVPHRITLLHRNRERIVSIMCFEMLT